MWEKGFPAELKFYWLHFDWQKQPEQHGLHQALLHLPQHTRVGDPACIIALFRLFLSEQENIHRSVALACIFTAYTAAARGSGAARGCCRQPRR